MQSRRPPQSSPTKTVWAGPQITIADPSVAVEEEKLPIVDPRTPPFTVQQPPSQSLPTANPIPGHMLYKNRLLQYAQSLGFPLPMYQTVNEGSNHAPRFRSTVLVDGVSYTSTNTYSHLKSAEQDVSQFALDSLIKKMKEQGYSILREDPVFCKSILHEFGAKMNMGMPTYSTRKSEGVIPAFVSSLVFNSVTYAGDPAKNKKEAEQLGARAVILSLLGNPEFETVLWDVIKSKFKFYGALHKAEDASNKQNSILSVEVLDENSNKISPCKEMQVPVVVSQHPSSTSVSSVSRQQMAVSPIRNTMVPELANAGVNVPFQGSHPRNELVPSDFQQSAVCSATDKKRLRRQKHKANKRARAQVEANVTYAGDPAKNKKEAEQLGARVVILSLLGNPEFETVLWDVIKSKFKFYGALHKAEDASNKQNSILSVEVLDENSNKISPCKEMQVPVVVSQHPSSTSVSSVSRQQMAVSPIRNTMVPELANAGVNVPFQGSHPRNELVPSDFQQSAVCSATDKKRLRRQKHKANKRARAQVEANVTYAGDPAKNKKEAEQLGARAVILSLLGNPEFETVLWDVIKSKFKFYGALHKAEDASNKQNSILSVEVLDENSNKISPCKEMQVPVVVSQHPSSTSVSSVSRQQMAVSPIRNTMVPELANAGVNVPFQGSHPRNELVPSDFQQSAVCSATDKKRLRRQKHKANKRARAQVEANLADASMAPENQTLFSFWGSVPVTQ